MPPQNPLWAVPGFYLKHDEPALSGALNPMSSFFASSQYVFAWMATRASPYPAFTPSDQGVWTYPGNQLPWMRRVRVADYLTPSDTEGVSADEVTRLANFINARLPGGLGETYWVLDATGPSLCYELAARAIMQSNLPNRMSSPTGVQHFGVLFPTDGSFEEMDEESQTSLVDSALSCGLALHLPCYVDQAAAEESGDMVSFIDAAIDGPGRIPYVLRRAWSVARGRKLDYESTAMRGLYGPTPYFHWGNSTPQVWMTLPRFLAIFDGREFDSVGGKSFVMPRSRFLDLVIWRALKKYPVFANVGASFLDVDSDHISTAGHTTEIVKLWRRYAAGAGSAQSSNQFGTVRPYRPYRRLYRANPRWGTL